MSRSIALLSVGFFSLPGLAQAAAVCDATPDSLSDCLAHAADAGDLEVRLAPGVYDDISWSDAVSANRVILKGNPGDPASVTLRGLTVEGAAARMQVEGVALQRTAGPVTVSGGSLELVSVSFTHVDGVYDGPFLVAQDGAFLTITDSSFFELAARDAVLWVEDSDCTLNGVHFDHNRVDHGSVVTAVDAQLSVLGSDFLDNESSLDGGSIALSGGTLEVDGSSFSGGESGAYGGHISAVGASTVVLDNTRFQGGDAMFGGGAVRLDSVEHAMIAGCLFAGNEARQGGALLMGGDTQLELRDARFKGNTAATGGQVMVQAGVLDMTRVWMLDGRARRGAGMAVLGGEVYARNVAFFKQQRAEMGGAILVRGGVLDLRYAVLAANPALEGSGLYLSGGEASLTGVIMDLSPGASNLDNSGNSVVSVNDSIVRGVVLGRVDSDGGLLADPMFLDGQHGDFHLQSGSPAIDAVGTGDLDLDGSVADMGIYGGPDAWQH